VCDVLKTRGVTVAVMQIPYPPFADPTNYANSEDFKVNDASRIFLRRCSNALLRASSLRKFAREITAGIQKLFLQAVAQARLTQ